jgi:hypothetical protein
VQATAADLEAHVARLAQLRKKAGRVVWDELAEKPEAAEVAVA